MKQEITNKMEEILNLHKKGWTYAKISRATGIPLVTVRRRILAEKNNNAYGDNHYYLGKYKIAIYDYRTKELVNVYKNLNELKDNLLHRTCLSSILSKAINKNVDYIWDLGQENKYYFKLYKIKQEVKDNYE